MGKQQAKWGEITSAKVQKQECAWQGGAGKSVWTEGMEDGDKSRKCGLKEGVGGIDQMHRTLYAIVMAGLYSE